MGLFDKVKKGFNSSLGLGKNNDLFNIGAAVMTGGASELVAKSEKGGISDILLGKKAKTINPDAIANQIRDTQSRGIGELNAALDTPSADIVREQATRQKTGVLSSAQDARRNAQKLIAQRGLGGSSIGLGLNRSIDQQAGKDIATIDAQMPGQIRNQQIQDATTRIGVGNVNQSGMNFNTIEGQRSGGILGIASKLASVAGMVAGGMAGGPAGASVGGQVGGGISSAFNRPKTQYGNYA